MKDSDKPLKPIAKVFIYIGVVLAIILAVVIICIAVMFFVPGTTILGYQYVKHSNISEHKFTPTSTLSISDIRAIEIVSEVSDLYIYPNTEAEDEIKIIYKEGMSGFTKAIDSGLNTNSDIVTKSFEGDSSELSTLVFSVDEPGGFVNGNGSYIAVYLPNNLSLYTISMKSSKGKIIYNSLTKKGNKDYIVSCDNLHLKTNNQGSITINNNQDISNYYLSTGYGAVMFNTISELNANTIMFETDAGAFEYSNKKGDAVINVINEFYVKSNKQSGVGPQIRVNNLIGNLRVETYNGYYYFNKIGEEENAKKVAITTNNSRIHLGTVYGQVSILSDGNKISNNIDIEYLVSSSSLNSLDAGEGNIYVKVLNGATALNTTSGQIRVDSASSNSSIWAHSTSGNININYVASEESNTTSKSTILTNTGNVDVKNISNIVNIHILSNGAGPSLNLSFTAIASTENIINARNRNLNIILVGLSEDLQHRIASTNKVTLPQTAIGAPATEIEEGDADSLRYSYKDYSYNYRIGYAKGNVATHPYDTRGIILINSLGNTTLRTA